MKIRLIFPLLLFLLSGIVHAQDCIVLETISTSFGPDALTQSRTVTVDYITGISGSWFADNGMTGDYGDTIVVTVSCGEEWNVVFTDDGDPSCQGLLYEPSTISCTGSCSGFRLELITDSGPCSTEDPIFDIIGGDFPMEAIVTAPSVRDTIAIPGPDRTLELLGYAPGEYLLQVAEADSCVRFEGFIIGTGECGTISGVSWLDENRDGIRQVEEDSAVIANVILLSFQDSTVDLTQIDQTGNYSFTDVPVLPGGYRIRFSDPRRDRFPTVTNQGPEATDSDIFQDRTTDILTLQAGEELRTLSDAGWVRNDCYAIFTPVIPDCGESNGSIVLETASGQTPASYTWSHSPADTDSFTDLPAGTYTVTVTFADGCSAVNSYDLTPEAGDFSIRQEGEICTGDGVTLMLSEGPDSVAVDPTGLVFNWSTGESTPSIEITQAGNYAVTISSSDGCVSVVRRFINGSPFVRIPLETSYRLDCETGTVTLELPEGFDPDLAVWVTPEGDLTGATVTLSSPGNVFLEYDVPGQNCNYSGFTVVTDPRLGDDLELAGFNADTVDCSDIVLLTVLGDNTEGETFDYSWTGPDGLLNVDRNFIRVTPVGFYQVVVTSECGSRTLQYDFGTSPLVCQDVSGRLFLDTDAGCSLTAGDIPTPGNLVEITSTTTGEQYFAFTNAAGEWGTELPEGTYTVTAMYDELAAVGTCPPTTLTLAGGSVANVDVFIPVLEACPLLSTSINAWRLRRCFQNQANIFYENRGTGAAAGAELTVLVDPFFEDITANLPFTRDGDLLTFDLGDVPVFGTGTIVLSFTVSCDAELGQLHCLEAGVTPNEPCLDPENWDGAVVNVSGARCDGDDEIVFSITNVGDAPMSIPLSYVIIEDGIMMLPAPTVDQPMEAGASIEIILPATGSTYQVVANQEPNAPASSRPSDLVEGCNGRTTGFGNLTENGNGNPGESTFCRENIGSYDPNEKLGFPLGFTEEHDIEPRTTLTYELHFQNTGTDTAFTVVIRDTISELYNLESIKLGAASHDYTATLDSQRVLTFTFSNILLPDSTTNLLGSQGVVTFTIDPLATLERGTRIRNRAGIYFDFNEPILTDYMNHRIAPEPILLANRPVEASEYELSVFPNPTDGRLNVTLDADGLSSQAQFVVSDLYGRELTRRAVGDHDGQWNVGALPAGYYLLLLEDGGLIRGRTAFVLAR